MTDGEGPQQVDKKITICHWSNGNHWNQITISTNALDGHDNHEFDIWPPVEGVTDGNNWGLGENVYMNGCQPNLPTPEPTVTVTATPTESPTMTSSPTLTSSPTQSSTPVPTSTSTSTPVPIPEPCPTTAFVGMNATLITAALVGSFILFRLRSR